MNRDEKAEVVRVIDIVRAAFQDLYSSQLPRMAAALGYRTLFGLIPMLAISLVLVGAFASEDQRRDAIMRLLDFTGISAIEVTAPPDLVGPPAPGEPLASSDAPEQFTMDEWITSLLNRIDDVRFRAIGLVGVLILLYAAISLVVEIERAFNQIYHASGGRSWLRRIPLYWTLLTLGGLLLISSFYVGEKFTQIVTGLATDTGFTSGSVVVAILGYIVTVCISTLMMLLIYTTLPNAKVQLRAAFAGALVAAILWEAGKWGFTRYLDYSTNYARLYGAIAIVPLFMLWVYLTWLIILFGLQVSYAVQVFDEWKSNRGMKKPEPTIVDPTVVITLAAAVGEAFVEGRSLGLDGASRAADLSADHAYDILQKLEQAGIIHEVADGPGNTYSLSKPPDSIRLSEILAVAEEITGTPDSAPGGRVRRRIRDAGKEAATGSLADALRSSDPPAEA